MATGSYVGPGSKFAAVCDYGSRKDNGNGTYTVTFNCYIAVSAGTNGFQGTIVTTNWSVGQVSIYRENAGYGTKTITVDYGKTASFTADAQYSVKRSNGEIITYESTATASHTWTPTYTVKYDANKGTGAPANQTKTYGKTLTLSSTIPTREGYTFLGWSESSTAVDETWKAGGSFTSNKNVTLYAVWIENEYVITLDPNGGTISRPTVHVFFDHEENNELSTLPLRPGCKFLGFYTSVEDDAVQVYDENGMCTNEGTYWSNYDYVYAGNITLYAHWEILNVGYYKYNGHYILCNTYGKVNGSWQPRLFYGKMDSTWKQGVTEQ